MSRFFCQFAVGAVGQACSGTWRVFSAKRKPDLYLMNLGMGGQVKATVHAPNPPQHLGWGRHYGFDYDAKSEIAKAVMRDGGRHKIRWTGVCIQDEVTLEWRIRFPGSSLDATTHCAREGTMLLPIPARQDEVEVCVLIGPPMRTEGYPRFENNYRRAPSTRALLDLRT